MVKNIFLVMALLLTCMISGCGGSGGSGLNGGISVTAEVTGSVINATATYVNPQVGNLIGVPITFSYQIGSQVFPLGTHNTNNSGSVSVPIAPAAFNGTQTITVYASTGNLNNFKSVVMTGRSMTVTPPPTLALTTTDVAGTSIPFSLPSSAGFVAITDPFNNDVSGHTIQIVTSFVSTNPGDTLSPPTATTTNSGGTAVFPGATGTLVVPATVGGVETMTITWTVTDLVTGVTGSGVTTVTLTKTA